MYYLPLIASAALMGAFFLSKGKGKIFGVLERGHVWPLSGVLTLLGGLMFVQQKKNEMQPELLMDEDLYDEDPEYISPEIAHRQKEFSDEFRLRILGPNVYGVVDPVRLREEGRMGQEPYFKWGGRQLLITREWPEGAQIPVTEPSAYDIPGLPEVSVGPQIDKRIWKG